MYAQSTPAGRNRPGKWHKAFLCDLYKPPIHYTDCMRPVPSHWLIQEELPPPGTDTCGHCFRPEELAMLHLMKAKLCHTSS